MISQNSPPLTIEGPTTASTVAALFHRAGFAERPICERLRLPGLDAVDQPIFKTLRDRFAGSGVLAVLADLFLFGRAVSRQELSAMMSADEVDAVMACDLVRPWSARDGTSEAVWSPVRLVPIAVGHTNRVDLLIAGDRADHPDDSPFKPFSDIVFPGHNPLTRQFLKLLPETQPESVLELCAGTGVAAIAMAATGSRVVVSDIAPRSVHFARFNAWLNSQNGVDAVCGDLYAPVSGRFDCILAHPPYVPALTQTLTYRDGGETGDEIIRRAVAGLPDYLNQDGTFLLLCLGMDTAEGPFEQRVRHWIGAREREFDVVFAVDSINPPELIATRLVDRASGSAEDLRRWRDLFERLQVREFVYGAVVIRRHPAGPSRMALTRRVLMTDDTSAGDFDRLFAWFDWLRDPDVMTRTLELRPTLAPDLRLEVVHAVGSTGFEPASYFLENGGRPFKARLATDGWVAALLGDFDGTSTVREVFARAKERGRAPADFEEHQLGQLICSLIERGCLRPRLD